MHLDRRVLPVVVLLALLVSVPASSRQHEPQSAGPVLTVSVTPSGPLSPGGVVVLRVIASADLAELTGDASGRPVRFWSAGSKRTWLGLVGVGLETRPGAFVVDLRGTGPTGDSVTRRASLAVERKQFATRRLQVDPRLANPPEEEVARIKEEAKAMADAFAIVTPERLWRGAFETPVPGTATSSYGRLTITNGEPSGRHQGADFRAETGTLVRAPNAGRVVLAQNLYFAGNTVIVDHGLGVFSLLAHLSRIDVGVGAVVSRGELLGESGATGRVTGPHLHWAVRFGETSVDPLALMAAVARLSEETTPSAAQ